MQVKRFLQGGAREGRWEVLTRKPLRPSAEELARNRRARSALLRAARRTRRMRAPPIPRPRPERTPGRGRR